MSTCTQAVLTVVFLRGRQVVEQILGPAVLILDLSLEGPEVWHPSKLGSSQLACLGVKVQVSPSIPFRGTPLLRRSVGPDILPADEQGCYTAGCSRIVNIIATSSGML